METESKKLLLIHVAFATLLVLNSAGFVGDVQEYRKARVVLEMYQGPGGLSAADQGMVTKVSKQANTALRGAAGQGVEMVLLILLWGYFRQKQKD